MSTRYGLYKNTKVEGDYLGYFGPIDIPYDTSDYIISVTKKYEHRPRKLAEDIYGEPELYWIFRHFNKEKIQDPIFDLVDGISIIVPDKKRLLSYF